jgi:hypothetical protein
VKITANKPQFVNELTDWFMADQDVKRTAQGRIQNYQTSLQSRQRTSPS